MADQNGVYDFSKLQDREEKPMLPPLPAVMQQAGQTNPGQYAESMRISRLTGIPIDVVQSNPVAGQQQARVVEYDLSRLADRSPVTGSFLSNYQNAVVAQNDVTILEDMEALLKDTSNVGRAVPAGAVQGIGMATSGIGRTIEAGGRMMANVTDFILPESADKFIWQNPADKYLQYVDPAAFLRARGDGLQQAAEIIGPKAEDKNLATEIAGGVGQMVGQALAYVFAPQSSLVMMFGQGVEIQGQKQDATGTYGQDAMADLGLIMAGLTTVATEKTGLDEILNRIPPNIRNKVAQAAADVMIAGGIEGLQEVVEGVTQSMIERVTTNPDAPLLEGAVEEGTIGFGVGAIVRALVLTATPGKLGTTSTNEQMKLQNGTQDQVTLDKLNELASATELRQLSPESFSEFVKSVDGENETNVYIDPVQLSLYLDEQKNKATPDAALILLSEQADEARTLGVAVTIPLQDFATVIAATPHYEALRESMTLSADAVPTFRQAQAVQEAESYMTRLVEEAKESASQYAEAQTIYNDIKQQLTDTGVVSPRNASAMAQIVPAWATVYAKKAGMTLGEVYAMSGLTIVGPQTGKREGLAQRAVNAVRGALGLETPTPAAVMEADEYQVPDQIINSNGQPVASTPQAQQAFKQWFGESKVTDAKGAPLVVYHGTNADFDTFNTNPGLFGEGVYLTTEREDAQQYSFDDRAPMQLYVNMRNPFITAADYEMGEGVDLDSPAIPLVREVFGERADEIIERMRDDDTTVSQEIREALQNMGHDGIEIQWEDGLRQYVAFNPTQIKSAIGNQGTFDAGDPSILRQEELKQMGARGYFNPKNTTIRLTEASDLSTFLHEFAHFMFEMEKNVSGETWEKIGKWTKRNAAEVAAEANTIIKDTKSQSEPVTADDVTAYIDNGTSGDTAKDKAIYVAVHEQFARAWEQYIMEGKAPSIELRNVFQTFARWMVEIYQKIKGTFRVNLDPEMRAVFDRMIATEEQIAAAEARAKIAPMFTDAAMAGMTPERYAEYLKDQQKVSDKAAETLREKLIGQLTRQTTQWWNNERDAIALEVREALKDQPVYRAIAGLRSGDTKLDKAAVREMVGEQKISVKGLAFTRLPRQLNGMTAPTTDGIHPDEAAILYGFSSGSELLNAIIKTPSLDQASTDAAQQAMLEKHGDILNDGSIQQEADQALQNEEQAKLILKEMKILNRRIDVDKINIRDMAKEKISKLSYREIHPQKYRAAELRAAQEAAKMLAAGNRDGAAAAKMVQLMNHYLAREATEAKQKIEAIQENVTRYNRKVVREEIMRAGNGYWEQIEKILDRFEFRKSATLKSVEAANENLLEWMKSRMAQDGDELLIDNITLNEGYQTHWKNVPFAALQGVADSVANIEHVARYANKIMIDGQKREFQEVVETWTISIKSKVKSVWKPTLMTTVEGESAKKWGKWAMAQMTKIPYMASWLDGGDRVGLSHSILSQPFNDALNEKFKLFETTAQPVIEAMRDRSKADKKRHMQTYYIEEIDGEFGGNLEGHQILAVALNVGNQSNLRKLLLGYGWADPKDPSSITIDNPKLQAVLKHMTESDWKLVQLIWGQMELLYPQLEEVHRRTTGRSPPKVEATPVQTPFGEFKGGYYPVDYDENLSHDIEMKKQSKEAEVDSPFSTYASIQSSINASATSERTGFYAPIKLNLDVVVNHFHDVTHYITHHDAVRQVNKLIRNKQVADSIKAALGPTEFAQLRPWLNDIAKDGRATVNKGFLDSIAARLRLGVTLGVMGFKASTGLIQLSGLSNATAEVGSGNMAKAMKMIFASPKDTDSASEFAFSRSKVLKHRANTMDLELRKAFDELQGKSGKWARFQEVSMKHIVLVQLYGVDIPSWYAGYVKELGRSGDEEKAAQYGDWVVEQIQGSGATKDMSALVRDPSKVTRMFTMFMTFFSALWNQQRDAVRGARRGKYSATDIAAKLMFLYTLPVIYDMLLRGELDAPDDEDDEDRIQKFLLTTASYSIGGIPFARDVANGYIGEFGYSMTPIAKILESGVEGSREILLDAGDGTPWQWKNTVTLAGVVTATPGVSQAWATGEHLYEVMEKGEDLTLRELVFGPEREE